MKNLTPAVMILVLLSAGQTAQSQLIRNQYQLIGELAFPIKEYTPGWHGQFKWLTRLGPYAQLTVSTGMSSFSSNSKMVYGKGNNLRLYPFLVGYRHNVKKVFIEPQAGYGLLEGRIGTGGDYARPSVGAFVWSLGAGCRVGRFDIGARYVGVHGAETSDAGLWYNEQFKYIGIFTAFNFRRTAHR